MKGIIHFIIVILVIGVVLFSLLTLLHLENKEDEIKEDVSMINKDDYSMKTEEILLKENETKKICETYVRADSVWISDGSIYMDIITWTDKNQKPMSGGYKKGDKFEPETNCTYYVNEIKKFGRNNENAGYIVLTSVKPVKTQSDECKEEETIEETTQPTICSAIFGVGNIFKRKNGKIAAMISMGTPKLGTFDVFEGDTLWVGEHAYTVSKIVEGKNEVGYVVLKKIKNLINNNTSVVSGELINAPNIK